MRLPPSPSALCALAPLIGQLKLLSNLLAGCEEAKLACVSLQLPLLSAKRRRLLDKLKEAELLHVEQANAIAIGESTCSVVPY